MVDALDLEHVPLLLWFRTYYMRGRPRPTTASREAVEPRRVFPQDLLLDLVRDIRALAKLRNGMWEVAVAVRIVRGEDDALRPQDVHRVRQAILVRLAGDEAAFAAHIVARLLRHAVGMVHRTRIVIVHAPHPVGQPRRADLPEEELDARVFIHHAAADKRHDADHEIEGHADHMDVEIRVFEPLLPDRKRTRLSSSNGSIFNHVCYSQ